MPLLGALQLTHSCLLHSTVFGYHVHAYSEYLCFSLHLTPLLSLLLYCLLSSFLIFSVSLFSPPCFALQTKTLNLFPSTLRFIISLNYNIISGIIHFLSHSTDPDAYYGTQYIVNVE